MNYIKEETFEKRNDRARTIGYIVGRLEMLEAKIEHRTHSFYDREDILEEVIRIREELDRVEL